MKKLFTTLTIIAFFALNAQTTANRFFYELTFKPKKDSARLDKVMTVLDVVDGKSIFRDYTMIAQDSLLKAKIEMMQKSGTFQDLSKEMKMPKFGYKITKKYPEMEVQYSETMANGMSPIQLAYNETPQFEWKLFPKKMKIGEYNAQKATTTFGGRTWTAWFCNDIPFPDGPYKFSGLPGLIVKVEDEDKNYSWELQGNKKVNDFDEKTQMEKIMPGGAGSIVEVSREKFEKSFDDYKKDPFSSFRSQMTPEIMERKMQGSDKTIGEMIKDQEKRTKDFYNANDNPIEIPQEKEKKK
ncbi:MAG: GLPGLI family protein [Flavobacteriaceae bacterium]|jgi:GLPGLI family protein|nr:GLPGLI family protein [Flavobacteriaceae bacterium]